MTITDDIASPHYDDFAGTELDTDKWMFLEYPLPDGSSHVCAEPNAQVSVGDGAYAVRIERFDNHHGVQIIDNPKHLLFTTKAFELPAVGQSRFSVRMSAEGLNTTAYDYRDGFAAFNVLDLVDGWVFDLAASSDRIFAIHERLPFPGVVAPFTHCVDAPLSGLNTEPGAEHRYSVALDREARTVVWEVDGQPVYWIADADVPERVQVGFGVFTLHPVQDDSSVSLRGQGFSARWRDLTVEIPNSA
ncbi:hypothetical protein IA539_17835 [Gordonia sp. zg691]|uniref:GH16 domain-containing protein n=1 Tax=Gordonia jinghuaiqii TaxID=2758710 RepID=A0A7D7R2U3_9ACTN|nr:DUF6081 family protein [Gordonia jinghuaiqii]MBD0863048.1 hypothetical protein [Gordonia jinghuaiqii]MCR5978824.1 hypothetical protein [Gordonia jinghuaiqii]QMT01827.1 hypothetical protein H1R19_01045 [Gordonia jinghuaiqii]